MDTTDLNPTQRFTSRAAAYVVGRPGYPAALLSFMKDNLGLTSGSVISDIGSGTGLLAKLFLDNGNKVIGVEPNQAMREAGDEFLADYPMFSSVDGTAEATTLADLSVDFVTAGQAFHWFDPLTFRTECLRILKPGGWIALIWNERRDDSSAFMRDLDLLIRQYGSDFRDINRTRSTDEDISTLFGTSTYRVANFDNPLAYDFDKLHTRLASGSYMPSPGDPEFDTMTAELRDIFEHHATDGNVIFEQNTKMYYGQLINL